MQFPGGEYALQMLNKGVLCATAMDQQVFSILIRRFAGNIEFVGDLQGSELSTLVISLSHSV